MAVILAIMYIMLVACSMMMSSVVVSMMAGVRRELFCSPVPCTCRNHWETALIVV